MYIMEFIISSDLNNKRANWNREERFLGFIGKYLDGNL